MKNKKAYNALVAQLRDVFPDEQRDAKFMLFARDLRNFVELQLHLYGLRTDDLGDFRSTWSYVGDRTFTFSVNDMLAVEVDPSTTHYAKVTREFKLNLNGFKLEDVIEFVGEDLKKWRVALVKLRSLQLEQVLFVGGREAYNEAKEREQ